MKPGLVGREEGSLNLVPLTCDYVGRFERSGAPGQTELLSELSRSKSCP